MSHLKERVEKNCLNCNAEVAGRYCQICGQENVIPKESIWHLVGHFFNDITHFDSKFFTTLRLLVFKPGYLSSEYVLGRRARYLNPVRMYIFTSFIFFLIFFSLLDTKSDFVNTTFKIEGKKPEDVHKLDSIEFKKFTAKINNGVAMDMVAFDRFADSAVKSGGLHFTSGRYSSKQEYDSLLKQGVKKHNWLLRKLIYKEIEANQTFHNNLVDIIIAFGRTLMHNIPKMLFISLPLIALILQVVYRKKKEHYYVGHSIFVIHFDIFVFIFLLAGFGIQELKNWIHWEWLDNFRLIINVSIFFYLYIAMRNFYKDSRMRTIYNFIKINLLTFIMFAVLLSVFMVFSFFKF